MVSSYHLYIGDFPGGASGKEQACQCRRRKKCELILGSRRSPGEGNGNPLQYSCLEKRLLGSLVAWLKRLSMPLYYQKNNMEVIKCFFCGVLFLYTSFGKLIQRHEKYFLLKLLRDNLRYSTCGWILDDETGCLNTVFSYKGLANSKEGKGSFIVRNMSHTMLIKRSKFTKTVKRQSNLILAKALQLKFIYMKTADTKPNWGTFYKEASTNLSKMSVSWKTNKRKEDGGIIPDVHGQGQEEISIQGIIMTATFQKLYGNSNLSV